MTSVFHSVALEGGNLWDSSQGSGVSTRSPPLQEASGDALRYANWRPSISGKMVSGVSGYTDSGYHLEGHSGVQQTTTELNNTSIQVSSGGGLRSNTSLGSGVIGHDAHLSSLTRQQRAPSFDSAANLPVNNDAFRVRNTSSPGFPSQSGTASLGLTHQRRHAASMTATTRGSRFDSGAFDENYRCRASSWSIESPKKLRGKTSGSNIVSDTARKVCGNSKVLGAVCNSWVGQRVLENRFLNRKAVRDNRNEFLIWVLLVALIVIGYKYFSDGSFSAILTLASAFQCFALILLFTKVFVQRTIAGVSQRSLLLIATCLVCRLASTIFYNGYLPVDRSGDWIYQLADVFTVILTVALLLYARWYCRTSVQCQQEKDTCYIGVPVAIAVILAVLIHPSLNQNVIADVSWTAGLYIETLAMIPQLYMMSKFAGEVEAVTSHYVASMAMSKVFAFLFWYYSYAELAPRNGGWNTAGYAVVLSYFIQAILFVDFFYYYLKFMRIGKRMIINF